MSGRCTIREDSRPCARPAAYVIVFDGCPVCTVQSGWLFCPGHPACIEHTAAARGDLYDWNCPPVPGIAAAELAGAVVPCRVSSREVPS